MNAHLSIVALRLALVASLLVAGAAGAGASDGAEQKIFLDPDTGDVMSTPPAAESDAANRRVAPSTDADAGQSWVNDDGVDMYTPGTSESPALQAVRCPDGSLRMGHAKTRAGEDERGALCAGDAK